MASKRPDIAAFGGAWEMLRALAQTEGSAAHPLPNRLCRYDAATRDLADTAHFLCLLHAHHPGLVEFAAQHTAATELADWFRQTSDAFAIERTLLAQVAAAAGPPPSTPGHAEAEAAVAAQRHALEMLAQSDRVGCAAGAAMAIVLDWPAIRALLDASAERFGITAPPNTFASDEAHAAFLQQLCSSLSVERAMLFGAQQTLTQQRGLWDLLEARIDARGDA